MDWVQMIVTGLLCGGAYWAVKNMGWLRNRSNLQQALVFFPIVFVIVLILNLIWPSS